MFFCKNHAKHEAGRLAAGLFYADLFFKNLLLKEKASGQELSFNTLW